MLFYQPSRKTNDVIHDAFEWMVINRHALGVIAMPIVAFCLVALAFTPPIVIDRDNMFDFIFTLYRPQTMPVCVVLTFVTTMLTALLAYRYFIERISLKTITLRKLMHSRLAAWRIAIAIALVMTGNAYMAYYETSGFTAIATAGMVVVAPCILGTYRDITVKGHLLVLCSSTLLIIFLFLLIKLLPLTLWGIAELILQMTPNLSALSISDVPLTQTIFTWLLMVCYCAALIFLLTASIMLHGAMYRHPITNNTNGI